MTIILKAKSIRSIFRRNGVKQGQPNKKCVRSSFTRKRKEVINLPTGVHCCGIYHNNDFKYLDHFKKHHLETATDKQDISLPITRTTLRRGVQSEDSDKCTGSKGEEVVGFLHQNPTFVFTHFDSKRLLCCGDVESNPGPTHQCMHEMCRGIESIRFSSIHDLSCHISAYHVFDIICGWDGCVWGGPDVVDREMETHILKHVYMSTIFDSFESWCQALPSGSFDENDTDLRLCPLP